jgi:preprotein translocase subunit Sec61beta
MWMMFWPQENATGIAWFWLLFILMQFRARLEAAWMVRRGDIVHTRYNGQPRVARLIKRLDEQEIKGRIEPSIVLIIGLAVLVIDMPLGSYLVVASLALSANHGLMTVIDRARVLEMNDVLIEQRAISEQFRGMQRS